MSVVAPLRATLVQGLDREMADLRRLDARRRAAEVAAFVALWVAGGLLATGVVGVPVAAAGAWGLRALGCVLVAVALNAFMLLTHEGHHGLLARGTRLNRWASVALAVPLLHAPTAYRVLHTEHHDHMGGPGDPDEYRNVATGRRLWAMHWMRLTIGPWIYLALIPRRAWRAADAVDRRRIVVEYAVLATCWAVAFAAVPLAVLAQVWLLPLVLVGYFTSLRGLAQHGLTDPADPWLSARTFRAGPVVRFCLLNENFHFEHHVFPEVPSYRLADLHALLAPRRPRAVEETSYLAFLARFTRRSLVGDDSPLGVVQAGGMAR